MYKIINKRIVTAFVNMFNFFIQTHNSIFLFSSKVCLINFGFVIEYNNSGTPHIIVLWQ